MAPTSWGNQDQKAFIELWMPEYLVKKAAKRLDKFWPKMKEAYYAEFPEEIALGLPVQELNPDLNAEPPRRLTEEETRRLCDAIGVRDKQLQNSFKNGHAKIVKQRGGVSRSASSLAATLFKARPKRKRRHQVLELYQKEKKAAVQAALRDSKYDTLNDAAQCRDEDGEWIDDDDDELKVKRITVARKQQMKIYRRVVQALWDKEEETLKERIRELARQEIVVPEATTDVESVDGKIPERTPEEYQLSIDESLQVAEMFLTEFQQMTGWVGALVYAGPMPRLGGELGLKSYSFGLTPGGVNFENSHPSWKKSVTAPLFKFARQAISRETRLSHALYADDDDEEQNDGLTPVEPNPFTPAVKEKKKNKSKRSKDKDARDTPAAADGSKPDRCPRKSSAKQTVGPTTVTPSSVPSPPMPLAPTNENNALGAENGEGLGDAHNDNDMMAGDDDNSLAYDNDALFGNTDDMLAQDWGSFDYESAIPSLYNDPTFDMVNFQNVSAPVTTDSSATANPFAPHPPADAVTTHAALSGSETVGYIQCTPVAPTQSAGIPTPRPQRQFGTRSPAEISFGHEPQYRPLYGHTSTPSLSQTSSGNVVTPKRSPYAPATSSPLTRPPLQPNAEADLQKSPPPAILPPRL
ncbi:hypothetical protein B0H19DRAFT_1275367 [Mycena capillaripes]|nr:hypothetical protein B0H19DRAFT_1275367 [Mycena capillaripes]